MIRDALYDRRPLSSGSALRPVPGPRGHRLLGSLLEVRRDKIEFVRRATRDHGDVVGFRMGRRRLYLFRHPEDFRHILCVNPQGYAKGVGLDEARPLLGDGPLTSEGELAAEQRRRLQAAFHGDRIHEMSREMTRAAEGRLDRWRDFARSGEPLDIAREMVALTLEVLGRTLLGVDLAGRADAISGDLATVARWAVRRMTALIRPPLTLPTPANLRVRHALRELEGLAREILEEGREDCALLPLLRAAGPDAARQACDELLTFLLAGHETTAAALTWTWYLLGHHPDVERRLHEELDRLPAGCAPRVADLPGLVWTRAVLDEAVRLYPPVWMIPRRALAEDETRGYRIPARTDILLSVYSLHRHPACWTDPDRFDPERFLGEGSERSSGAYMPFGAGPRSCLGSRYGLMEAALIVATLARRFRVEPIPGAPVQLEAALTLRPRHGLTARLKERGPA